MDFSTICRTCIKTSSVDLNPIFLTKDTHERFSSAFYACTGIQVKYNDGLPQNMCTSCMNQFNNTLKFRKQCKQAETQLLKIKIELETENTTFSNEEAYVNITNSQIKNKHLSTNKLESDIKRKKSEYNSFNIKNEPIDIQNREHKISTGKIYNSQDGNTVTSDTECLNEQTILTLTRDTRL